MTQLLARNVVLMLHEAALIAHGGMYGLRDSGLLDSALSQPLMTFGGQDLYPTTFEKASALATSLVLNHPFVDGNKRVGYAAMKMYLRLSGYELTCTADEGEAMFLSIAAHTTERNALVAWIEKHTKPAR